MDNPPSLLRLRAAAIVVAAAGMVVGGAYLAGEWGPWAEDSSSAPPAGSSSDSHEQVRQPLPDDITTLEATWTLAFREARSWREDAQLTRVYATEVAVDGTIRRATSTAQFVFLSPGATSAGPPVMNGWRWVLDRGTWSASEIMQQPAPELGNPAPALCEVAKLLGGDAPPLVTIDVQFAPLAPMKPTFQAFADQPEKWLLIADPVTCEVRMRSSRTTPQEAASAAVASSATGPGAFDVRAAQKAFDDVMSRASSCEHSDAGLTATLSLTFTHDGTVERVDIEPPALQGGVAFTCLAERLRRARVAPWQRGDGRIVRRIPF